MNTPENSSFQTVCPCCGSPISAEICPYCGSQSSLPVTQEDSNYPIVQARQIWISLRTAAFPLLLGIALLIVGYWLPIQLFAHRSGAENTTGVVILTTAPFGLMGLTSIAVSMIRTAAYLRVLWFGKDLAATVSAKASNQPQKTESQKNTVYLMVVDNGKRYYLAVKRDRTTTNFGMGLKYKLRVLGSAFLIFQANKPQLKK